MVARADECYFFARVSSAERVSGQDVITEGGRMSRRSLRLKAAGQRKSRTWGKQ
jgi:hypothetical protein